MVDGAWLIRRRVSNWASAKRRLRPIHTADTTKILINKFLTAIGKSALVCLYVEEINIFNRNMQVRRSIDPLEKGLTLI